MIDSHVHCRDFEEAYKETIVHALRVAEDSGLSAIFDMPNTKPATTTRELVLRRLDIAETSNSPVFYGLYIGLTANPDQIKEAVKLHGECFPASHNRAGVIGLKMFAGKSVGDLGIIDEKSQRLVYRTLAREGYTGVLAVHCEKESLMKPELWDPDNPVTHSRARPEESEIESIADQVEFARAREYEGHLHICHVSTPKSVRIVNDAKTNGMRISCGVTPHHLLLDKLTTVYSEDGILYKVNPPLRNRETRLGLFACYFLDGEIDILESDHAPHILDEKTGKTFDAKGNPQYMSGIPNLASWPDFTKILIEGGTSPKLIERMTHNNVNRIFRTNIPRLNLPLKPGVHMGEYAFDAYKNLK